MTRPLAPAAGRAEAAQAAGAGPPTSQHLAVAVHAVVHAREDVGQRGLAHALLPDEHHPVVGVLGLRGDDRVGGVGGPALAAGVLGGRGALASPAGLPLDHEAPAVRRDAPALLLRLRAHGAPAQGDIVQSHRWVLRSRAAGGSAAASTGRERGGPAHTARHQRSSISG